LSLLELLVGGGGDFMLFVATHFADKMENYIKLNEQSQPSFLPSTRFADET